MNKKYYQYNWNNPDCYLQRKTYGEYLSNYIRNQKTSLVLNLNGEWGTGKTHFLKQLYTELHSYHNLPTVYIDAWESDFSDDPLLVVLSEITDQLLDYISDEDDDKKKVATEKQSMLLGQLGLLTKRIYNASLDVAAAYISTKNEEWETGLDATALTSIASHLKVNSNSKTVEIDEPKYGKSLKENYKKQYSAINKTKLIMKEFISFISNNREIKAYILIDELDRCKPSYAIEMLEVIKHFFETPNFVFVVATDTQQLSHSVKAVYGSSFNGEEYLTRFFNRTATLPKGNLFGFIKGVLVKTSILERLNIGLAIPNFSKNSNFGKPLSKEKLDLEELTNNLMLIAEVYNISLRKLEQAIAKLDSILLFEAELESTLFDYQILFQLIIESNSDTYCHVYNERKSDTRTNYYTFDLTEGTKSLIKSTSHRTSINGCLVYPSLTNISSYSKQQDAAFIIAKLDLSLSIFKLASRIEDLTSLKSYPQRYDSSVDKVNGYIVTLAEYIKSNSQMYIWTPKDYFSRVQLASSLT